MKKKKKGSTLLTVVIIFGILITVGTAALALTASDYKLRIGESKRIQNLYSSDSGLDIAQAIMRKTVETAIIQGNKEVESFLNNPTGFTEVSAIETEKNNRFETKLKSVINDELKICIEGVKNVKYASGTNVKSYEEVSFSAEKKPQLSVQEVNYHDDTKTYDVKIQATFSSKNASGVEEQKRTIQAKYTITEPSYKGAYYVETNKQSIPQNPVYQKAITIDGNMTLSGDVDINGKVFVKGNDTVGLGYANKYSDGVTIDGTNIKILDTLVTDKSIKVNNAGSLVLADVFARNFSITNATQINVGTLVMDNDLNISDNIGLSVVFDNLYGIGDINDADATNGAKDSRARVSSSIILNSIQPHIDLKVTGKTYLMGTAYINTDPSYQTGESVAVRGNYKAYTYPLQKDDTKPDMDKYISENVNFGYYVPLQLVDKFKDLTSINGFQKGEYFYYYNEKYGGTDAGKLQKGGTIELNPDPEKTVTAGAFIGHDGKIFKPTIAADSRNIIEEKQNAYATNVYLMGKSFGDQAIYNKQWVRNTVADTKKSPGDDPIQRQAQINFGNITNTNKVDSNNVLVLNNDPSKTVVLRGGDYNNFNSEYTGDKYIIVDVTSAKNGVIITKGDVEAVGVFTYTGTIIAGGNFLATKGLNKKTITYDVNVIQDIMTKNIGLFKDVIEGDSTHTLDAGQAVGVDTGVSNYIDGSQYIKSKLWTIVK